MISSPSNLDVFMCSGRVSGSYSFVTPVVLLALRNNTVMVYIWTHKSRCVMSIKRGVDEMVDALSIDTITSFN